MAKKKTKKKPPAAPKKKTKAVAKKKKPAAPAKKKKKAAPAPKKKAKAKPAKPAMISLNVTLREHLPPLDRGERYEDPIAEALEEAGLGEPGDGGGTLMGQDGEPEESDFDLDVHTTDAIPLVIRMLEERGAAKGSRLTYERDGEPMVIQLGITEEVAIYLDGITQPEEVYKTSSIDELFDKLAEALGSDLDCRGSWQGPRETALYFNGLDAEALFTTMEPVLRAYPLSRNARVVIRNRLPDRREVRLG